MSALKTTFAFSGKASFPKNAIALIYDLEGFSRFFNQPDVQDYIPHFLNNVSKAVSVSLLGGKPYYTTNVENFVPLDARVMHEKFLGDGALYILQPPKDKADFSTITLSRLCNRIWNIQLRFKELIKSMSDDIPVFEVPTRIRFGLARGSVYELRKSQGGAREYIGFCVNLASRLQQYCPSLGFIASARLQIPAATFEKHGYIKVVATQIKGFPKELVIVDHNEFERLDNDVRSALFANVDET
jgi:class 3 adenylate cyclase